MKYFKEVNGETKIMAEGSKNNFKVIIFLIVLVMLYLTDFLIAVETGLFLVLAYMIWKEFFLNKKREKKRLISNHISLNNIRLPENMPLPYVLFDEEKNILLYNENFAKLFLGEEWKNKTIDELLPSYEMDTNEQIVKIAKEEYQVYSNRCEAIDTEKEVSGIYSLCMVNITENQKLRRRIENEKTVVALLFLDNYEEVTDAIEENKLPILTAVLDRKLTAFVSNAGGIIKKIEKDRYIVLLSREKLEHMKDKKFEILNEIREIDVGNHMPVTVSMGVGVGGESLDLTMKSARAAIDLALGRGGDQVLVKEGEKYLFYGGKTGEVSHNARIRARVKADALWELLGGASEVFVMGHKNADLDSFGSSIGISAIAKTMGKPCYIILEEVSVGIQRLHQRIISNEEQEVSFCTGKEAMQMISERSLVVVTDTHRYPLTEYPKLLDEAAKVVIFDHHRKSTDFIEKAVLIYHEPYASSTSELVTEMIQYFGERVRLKPMEADALLAGITVDTKNFFVKTGTITFEAAAFLKRSGADSIRVRLLLQNDMETYKAIAATVKDAEVFKEGIAISVCPNSVGNTVLTSAQAADNLLNIVGIKASFVSCQVGNIIYISARSFGDVNVQVIMEKMGGGGHMTVAATQLTDTTLEESNNLLRKSIEEYMREEL